MGNAVAVVNKERKKMEKKATLIQVQAGSETKIEEENVKLSNTFRLEPVNSKEGFTVFKKRNSQGHTKKTRASQRESEYRKKWNLEKSGSMKGLKYKSKSSLQSSRQFSPTSLDNTLKNQKHKTNGSHPDKNIDFDEIWKSAARKYRNDSLSVAPMRSDRQISSEA